MKMKDKMRDVETSPYMLAIYKDNEYHHLLRHALKHWEARRHKSFVGMGVSILGTNPIYNCPYPPMELLDKYSINPMTMVSSRVLKCPKIARWALEMVLQSDEVSVWAAVRNNLSFSKFLTLIEFDDYLLSLFAMAGVADALPSSVKERLTPEQQSLIAICA